MVDRNGKSQTHRRSPNPAPGFSEIATISCLPFVATFSCPSQWFPLITDCFLAAASQQSPFLCKGGQRFRLFSNTMLKGGGLALSCFVTFYSTIQQIFREVFWAKRLNTGKIGLSVQRNEPIFAPQRAECLMYERVEKIARKY